MGVHMRCACSHELLRPALPGARGPCGARKAAVMQDTLGHRALIACWRVRLAKRASVDT